MWSIDRYDGSVVNIQPIQQPFVIDEEAPNYKEIELKELDNIVAIEIWICKLFFLDVDRISVLNIVVQTILLH